METFTVTLKRGLNGWIARKFTQVSQNDSQLSLLQAMLSDLDAEHFLIIYVSSGDLNQRDDVLYKGDVDLKLE